MPFNELNKDITHKNDIIQNSEDILCVNFVPLFFIDLAYKYKTNALAGLPTATVSGNASDFNHI